MQSSSTNSGVSTINVYFEIGRDPDLAAVDVQNRVNQALGRMPADVRTNGVTVTKNTAGFMGGLGFFSQGQPLRRAVHQQLPRPLRARRAQARAGRRQRHHLRRAQVRDAPVARPGAPGRARHHRRRRRERAARAEPAGRGRRAGRRPRGRRPDVQPQRPRAGPADRALAVRERRGQGRARRRARARARRRARRAGRRDLLVQPALRRPRGRRAWACSCCRRPTRSRSTRA